ncbi:XRE family transcriptional regulator, partial [Streptomyces sp. ISL-36]|nr:XRE family transcriptional regulator [Streptomyces sp. ISL-36]
AVAGLAATLLGPGPSSASPTAAPGPPRPAAPSPAQPPFTWTADSHVWKNDCGHVYVAEAGPRQVAPPPPAQDAGSWARTHGAVHGGETLVRISLQGRSPTTAVVVEALHVRVTGRAERLPWHAYRMDNGCGGALSPRRFDVDLDRPRPVARSVAGYDGLAGRPIPAVSLPYTVTSSAPEELLVTARTAGCDCRWHLELKWSSEGRSGTVRITDDGRPFRTSGVTGRPVWEYDTLGRRWVESEAAQQGASN